MENLIITINREFGSGGRIIGEELANRLNISLIDGIVLKEAAKAMNVNEKFLKKFEEKAPSIWGGLNQTYGFFQGMTIPSYQDSIINNELYITQTGIIKEISLQESGVFIGRCANDILKDNPRCVKIFLHGDLDFRVQNLTDIYGFKKVEDIKKKIKKIDKKRSEYYKTYTQREWKDISQYDLIIDTGLLGLSQTVELILEYLRIKGFVKYE